MIEISSEAESSYAMICGFSKGKAVSINKT